MQSKLTPSNTTYLNSSFQAVESTGTCTGCFFISATNPCNIDTPCESHRREDGKDVIWIKVEKEEPVVKSSTIKDIRTKVHTLQGEIHKLVEAFETDTGMVVHGIDLVHAQVIGEASTTYSIDLDVRLN